MDGKHLCMPRPWSGSRWLIATATRISSRKMATQPQYTVPLKEPHPSNHRLHTESTTTIFLPNEGAFLNPVQHYNRDMSVAVIRAWNEMRKEELEEKWRIRLERRGGKPRPKKKKSKKATEGEAKAVATETEEQKTEKDRIMEVEGDALAEVKEGEEPVAGPSNGAGIVSYIKTRLELWLICGFRANSGPLPSIFLKLLLPLVLGLSDTRKKSPTLSMSLPTTFHLLLVKR